MKEGGKLTHTVGQKISKWTASSNRFILRPWLTCLTSLYKAVIQNGQKAQGLTFAYRSLQLQSLQQTRNTSDSIQMLAVSHQNSARQACGPHYNHSTKTEAGGLLLWSQPGQHSQYLTQKFKTTKVHDILFYPSSNSKGPHWLFQNTTFMGGGGGGDHQSKVTARVTMNWGHFNFSSPKKRTWKPSGSGIHLWSQNLGGQR